MNLLTNYDIPDDINLLANLIAKGPFTEECFLYLKYKKYDLDNYGLLIIQEFLKKLVCLEEFELSCDYFMNSLTNLLFQLKGDLVELCNERMVIIADTNNHIEHIKMLTLTNKVIEDANNELQKVNSRLLGQIKTWIEKSVESKKIMDSKDIEINKLQEAMANTTINQIKQEELNNVEIAQFKKNNDKIIKDFRFKNDNLKKENDNLKKENDNLKKENDKLTKENDKLNKENDKLNKENDSNSNIMNNLIQENKKLKLKIDKLQNLNEKKSIDLQKLEELLVIEREKVFDLNNELKNKATNILECYEPNFDQKDNISSSSIDSSKTEEIFKLNEFTEKQNIKINNLEKKIKQMENLVKNNKKNKNNNNSEQSNNCYYPEQSNNCYYPEQSNNCYYPEQSNNCYYPEQ